MLSNEELELYDLAFHLRIPLYKLLEEMPYEELRGWIEYFSERPIGWREDFRAAQIMKSFGGSFKMEDVFPSLKKIMNTKPSISQTLKSSAFYQQMLTSSGEKPAFLLNSEGDFSANKD